MSQITIQQVIKKLDDYTGTGQDTGRSYTIYTHLCKALIDGGVHESVQIKTSSRKIVDRLKAGAVFIGHRKENNGFVSYKILLKENEQAGGGSGGGSARRQVPAYTFPEITALFKSCFSFARNDLCLDLTIPSEQLPELISKLAISLFIGARDSGVKIGGNNPHASSETVEQPELPTKQATSPEQTAAVGVPVTGANKEKGVRDYILDMGVPPEKVNLFLEQQKKPDWTTAYFIETLKAWISEYKWDNELDELVKKTG